MAGLRDSHGKQSRLDLAQASRVLSDRRNLASITPCGRPVSSLQSPIANSSLMVRGRMKGKKTMLAIHRDAPAWRRNGRALRQPETPNNKTDVPVDTERLVWDQEYRDEIRTFLKTNNG